MMVPNAFITFQIPSVPSLWHSLNSQDKSFEPDIDSFFYDLIKALPLDLIYILHNFNDFFVEYSVHYKKNKP